MRILYIDIDTLRADHLGCYGYKRNTSPNIDRIAEEGIRFDNCFGSDAICLASRSAFISGRFGIHTGVVNHGGKNADMRTEGENRGFCVNPNFLHFPKVLKDQGKMKTVTISSFAERHSAWWFYQGFSEMYDPGKGGHDKVEDVLPIAEDWLNRNAESDNWFLHVNFWDTHVPHRTPKEFGNPFENTQLGDNWMTDEILEKQQKNYGPFEAVDMKIKTMNDYKKKIDDYDTDILYVDIAVGKIMKLLEEKEILDDTIIMISADHGESFGELGAYVTHCTCDSIINRVPFILRHPKLANNEVFSSKVYQTDMAATILELCDLDIPEAWDGKSFAKQIKEQEDQGRDYLVISQLSWICQRAVVFDNWIMIRTYYDTHHQFPQIMLFNRQDDPHLTNDVAREQPELIAKSLVLMEKWHTEMMIKSNWQHPDPLQEVMAEGGPWHSIKGWNQTEKFIERHRSNGNELIADKMSKHNCSNLPRFK